MKVGGTTTKLNETHVKRVVLEKAGDDRVVESAERDNSQVCQISSGVNASVRVLRADHQSSAKLIK